MSDDAAKDKWGNDIKWVCDLFPVLKNAEVCLLDSMGGINIG